MQKDSLINAEYLFFEDDISKEKYEAISSFIKNDFLDKQSYDIIIISVDSINDDSTKMFFEHFQSSTRQKIRQPFILFLILKEKEPNIKSLYNLIKI